MIAINDTSISLGKHVDGYVRKQVDDGRFSTADEVVCESLKLLECRDLKIETLEKALVAGERSGAVPYAPRVFTPDDTRGRDARALLISNRARLDLDKLWSYGRELWGPDSANLYLDDLERRAYDLLDRPTLGQTRELAHPGYRSLYVARHVILYRFTLAHVRIQRILHNNIDLLGRP